MDFQASTILIGVEGTSQTGCSDQAEIIGGRGHPKTIVCHPHTDKWRPCSASEVHESAIEERYCPKEHVHFFDDKEWEALLARGLQFFNDPMFEPAPLSPIEESVIATSCESSPIERPTKQEDDESFHAELLQAAPPPTPASSRSVLSTPSLMDSSDNDDAVTSAGSDCSGDFEYPVESPKKKARSAARAPMLGIKRKRGKVSKALNARKRLARTESSSSVATVSSLASIASDPSSTTAQLLQSMMNSDNPWKCPHCPWVQHTQRLPDFLRHQRSHFVSQSDWPCPNPKCGKGFARKDSLKRHLDNKATGCKRPPGYTVC